MRGTKAEPGAVLWDLDGTLADSKEYHWRSWVAAMEEEERSEVAELLQYEPETAGGLMGKEFTTCTEDQRAGHGARWTRTISRRRTSSSSSTAGDA